MLSAMKHIHARRRDLERHIDVQGSFEAWEETCVPSYCHKNLLAAYVSWWRLFRAVRIAEKARPDAQRVLDFGSSVGELGHLLPDTGSPYEFVELDDQAAGFLSSRIPGATRQTLESAPDGAYDWVFAIDSLEHNDNYAELVGRLARKLSPRGIFIISGPTENHLYRLGRSIAGFDAHYHLTTIYEIEQEASRHLSKKCATTVLPGAPLFRISAWANPATDGASAEA